MKKLPLVTLICLAMGLVMGTVSDAKEGNGVGNGGGFAICSDQKAYSYDYVVTKNYQAPWADSVTPDLQSSLENIASSLKRLQDPLADDFELFVVSLFNQSVGAKYQWLPRNGLPLLWEPDLDRYLPQQCRNRRQAVYFFAAIPGVPHVSYTFDPALIQQVLAQENGAHQVSYLVVHEWLWNFFPREQYIKLAIFNRLLHSAELSQMSQSEFLKYRPAVLK